MAGRIYSAPVSVGDPIRGFPAGYFNTLGELHKEFKAGGRLTRGDRPETIPDRMIESSGFWIRNVSEEQIPQGGALRIVGPVITPAESEGQFLGNLALDADLASCGQKGGFAILHADAGPDQSVLGVVDGFTIARVNVIDTGDRFCDLVDGSAILKSSRRGSASIRWIEPIDPENEEDEGIGERWALIHLNDKGTTSGGSGSSGISYGGVELLSARGAERPEVADAAQRLAQRIGLDVSGVNELVWPNGADRFGGMIGLIEEERVQELRDVWEPYRDAETADPSSLPSLQFHDAPIMLASLAALEAIDPTPEESGSGSQSDSGSASQSGSGSESGSGSGEDTNACGRLWLVALADGRRVLQEASFSPVSDPAMTTWATAIDGAMDLDGREPGLIVSHTIAADRLKPEIDDPQVLAMTRGEFLEAVAWSVGGQWRLRTSGELELQSPSQADATEDTGRGFAGEPAFGAFDEAPLRPVAAVRLSVRESRGAVPWPRGDALFDAEADPAVDAGLRWNPQSTALWERLPVDFSPEQENSPELQDLADALLADAEAWTGRIHRVVFEGFVIWTPSARDRCVRWIDREERQTIVESLTPEDLPTLLIHRSAVVPREASLVEASAVNSGSPGGDIICELLATTGRPARQVKARYPNHPAGSTVCPGQSLWLDYDRSAGQWILPPWAVDGEGECPSGSGSDSTSGSGSESGSESGSASTPGSESGSTSGSGSGSESTPGSESGSESTPGSGSGSGSTSGGGSGGSSSGGDSGSTDGSGSILPVEGCCEAGDEMIETYVFEWTNTDAGTGSGGIQIEWNGSVWFGEDDVMVPDGEGGFTPCHVVVQMNCEGGPAEFRVTVNASSDVDFSAGGVCNPLNLVFTSFGAGCITFLGCSVHA